MNIEQMTDADLIELRARIDAELNARRDYSQLDSQEKIDRTLASTKAYLLEGTSPTKAPGRVVRHREDPLETIDSAAILESLKGFG